MLSLVWKAWVSGLWAYGQGGAWWELRLVSISKELVQDLEPSLVGLTTYIQIWVLPLTCL